MTAILLVIGVMDLRLMVVVTAAITVEPSRPRLVSALREPSELSSSAQDCS